MTNQVKVTEAQKIEHIEDIIKTHLYLTKQEDGTYEGEIYADYRDELGEESIKKILQSNSPMDTFYEYFEFVDFDSYEYEEVFRVIKKQWDEEEAGEFDYDFVSEWIDENIHFNFSYDHFLKQDVNINIMVNTGDGNYDFTLNNFASYNGDPFDTIPEESAILWLVRQQGYTKTDLNNLVRYGENKGSKFLQSILVELTNVTTHMNALTFFVGMTLKEAIDFIESPYDLILPECINCGLYDPWSGAGSVLEIQLENPVKIPKKFIEAHLDGTRGYGVKEIYGMDNSLWR